MTRRFMYLTLFSVALFLCGTMWGQKPNVTVQMKSVERVGYHVWVTYMITNNEGQDKRFDLMNPVATNAYSSNGEKYSVLIKKGDRLYPEYADINFPSGLPIKVVLIVGNVPATEKELAKVSLGLATPWGHFPYANMNVAIKEPAPNSDNPETVLNYPWINIKTQGCSRSDGEPTQHFTLMSEQDVKVEVTNIKAYDEEGNAYDAYIGTGVSSFTIPCGIPLKATASVKNVPAATDKLLAIKVDLRIDGLRYLLQFNNVKIESFTAEADDRTTFDLKGNVRECRVTLNGMTETYRFDPSGIWTEWNGMNMQEAFPGGIDRDDQGRLSEGKRDQYGEYFHRFTYDDKGNIRTMHICEDMEGGYIETYRRSLEGEVIRIDRRGGFDPNGKPEVTICTIMARDTQGNWTKRKRGTAVETRTIVYY